MSHTTGTSELFVLTGAVLLFRATALLCSHTRQVRHGETRSPSKGSFRRQYNSLHSLKPPRHEVRQKTKIAKCSHRGRCCFSRPPTLATTRGHQATRLTICSMLIIYLALLAVFWCSSLPPHIFVTEFNFLVLVTNVPAASIDITVQSLP